MGNTLSLQRVTRILSEGTGDLETWIGMHVLMPLQTVQSAGPVCYTPICRRHSVPSPPKWVSGTLPNVQFGKCVLVLSQYPAATYLLLDQQKCQFHQD